MNIRETVLALCIALALPVTAQAGGPVIIEEPPQVEADTEDGRIPGWVIPVAVIAIAILSSGGSDTCNGDEAPSEPGCQ